MCLQGCCGLCRRRSCSSPDAGHHSLRQKHLRSTLPSSVINIELRTEIRTSVDQSFRCHRGRVHTARAQPPQGVAIFGTRTEVIHHVDSHDRNIARGPVTTTADVASFQQRNAGGYLSCDRCQVRRQREWQSQFIWEANAGRRQQCLQWIHLGYGVHHSLRTAHDSHHFRRWRSAQVQYTARHSMQHGQRSTKGAG